MTETKEEFLARMAEKYDKLRRGEQLAESIMEAIRHVKSQGYKIIIMGETVKITI